MRDIMDELRRCGGTTPRAVTVSRDVALDLIESERSRYADKFGPFTAEKMVPDSPDEVTLLGLPTNVVSGRRLIHFHPPQPD